MTRAKGKAQGKQTKVVITCAYCSKEAVPVRCTACASTIGGGIHHHGMAHINSRLKPLCEEHREKQRELASNETTTIAVTIRNVHKFYSVSDLVERVGLQYEVLNAHTNNNDDGTMTVSYKIKRVGA